jgi:hypothetical protein
MYQPILEEDAESKILAVCAWCKTSRIITEEYAAKGWMVTHGICHEHSKEFVNESKKVYENKDINSSVVSESTVEWL